MNVTPWSVLRFRYANAGADDDRRAQVGGAHLRRRLSNATADNIHISVDILRRELDIAPTAIVERLRVMASLGFKKEIRSDDDHGRTWLSSDGSTPWPTRTISPPASPRREPPKSRCECSTSGAVTRGADSALSSASKVWISHCWHRQQRVHDCRAKQSRTPLWVVARWTHARAATPTRDRCASRKGTVDPATAIRPRCRVGPSK